VNCCRVVLGRRDEQWYVSSRRKGIAMRPYTGDLRSAQVHAARWVFCPPGVTRTQARFDVGDSVSCSNSQRINPSFPVYRRVWKMVGSIIVSPLAGNHGENPERLEVGPLRLGTLGMRWQAAAKVSPS